MPYVCEKCGHKSKKPNRFGLTFQQSEVLGFIEASIDQTGVSPSYREIANYMGFASASRVSDIVHALVNRGFIRKKRNRARSIALTEVA